MENKIYRIGQSFLLVLAIFMISACDEKPQQGMGPGGPGGPVPVDAITVTTSKIKVETELPGRTNAFRVAEVRPQVNGIIKKRAFVEGSDVSAGQLLYQIDPATYQAQYDSAKATLAKAKAYEHSAKLKANRYRKLVKTKAVSEIDQIEMDATWKQSVADVAAAQAALNSAKINLDYTRITAPISGVIGKSLITEGALVTAQQSVPLAKIQQLDPIYVDVTQSSTEMLRLKKEFTGPLEQSKQEITITLEDGAEYGHKGTLEFSDVTVEQSTGTVTLRALIDNPDRELLPGMFVRTKLSKGLQEKIVIPAAAISRTQKGDPMVMVIGAESKAEVRMITTGQNIGEQTVVQTGLEPGDQVITAGLQKIRPGAPVAAAAPNANPGKQGEK